MMSFYARVSPGTEEHDIEARHTGGDLPFTLQANISHVGDVLKIRAKVECDNRSDIFSGVLQADGLITGTRNYVEEEFEDSGERFTWSRIAPELMTLRPMPPYLVPSKTDNSPVPNKARALFDYAIRATVFQYQRQAWSWRYFKARRNARLSQEGDRQPLAAVDNDFYYSVYRASLRLRVVHR